MGLPHSHCKVFTNDYKVFHQNLRKRLKQHDTKPHAESPCYRWRQLVLRRISSAKTYYNVAFSREKPYSKRKKNNQFKDNWEPYKSKKETKIYNIYFIFKFFRKKYIYIYRDKIEGGLFLSEQPSIDHSTLIISAFLFWGH